MLDPYHCVGDFDLHDDDHPVLQRIPALLEDDLPELMSQKGSVVHPVHGDRVQKRLPLEQPVADGAEIGSAAVEAAARRLFVEEDGMTAWLHYQIGDDDGDLYRELPAAGAGDGRHVPAVRGHAPAVEKQGVGVSIESSRVVEPSETPAKAREAKAHAGDGRKRKAREGDDSECQSEDAEFDSGDKRKDTHRSPCTRRSGAAEVHNLAERRRRDRINEKMKALQELIPRCNKSDKASMLDEAIEYLKSLQLQVQMMSVGCNTEPAIFPGVQTYRPHTGIGMGLGMGMALGTGPAITMGPQIGVGWLGLPVHRYGSFFPCAPLFGPAPAQPGPISFQSPNMGLAEADQTRVRAPWQPNPLSNMLQIPHAGDPYCHFMGVHHLNGSSQSCAMDEPGASKGMNAAESNKLG